MRNENEKKAEALELIFRTWERTDTATHKANDNNIHHYVEFGDFERDAFIDWYEGLSDGLDLDDVSSEVEYLHFATESWFEFQKHEEQMLEEANDYPQDLIYDSLDY